MGTAPRGRYYGGVEIFWKTDRTGLAGLRLEVAGLDWLAQAAGAPVVPVIHRPTPADPRLGLQRLRERGVDKEAAYAFGQALARTHAAGAPSFGCAPQTLDEEGSYGLSRQRVHWATPENPGSWGQWFAAERLFCMVGPARDNGSLSAAGAQVIEAAAQRVADGEFDAPQPGLVKGPVARIHGDLWSGNVMWVDGADLAQSGLAGGEDGGRQQVGRRGSATSAVLIDPMAHGGHAETDLAHLGVFGQSYLREIYAGYQAVSPLAPGWQERALISQLHMIVMHAAIFGGSYGREAVSIARQFQ